MKLVELNRTYKCPVDDEFVKLRDDIANLVLDNKKLDSTDKSIILWAVHAKIIVELWKKNLWNGVGASVINFNNCLQKIHKGENPIEAFKDYPY